MKKNILYSLAVMASLTLASCNGDYDDWASPQTNSPEEAAAKYGVTFSAGEEADVNMASTQYDSYVNLVKSPRPVPISLIMQLNRYPSMGRR